MATLTVTKFLTGRFVALQRRDISAGAATTELRVEVVHLAILNEMTNGYPAGEVVEVRFPADLNLNQYPRGGSFPGPSLRGRTCREGHCRGQGELGSWHRA